MSRGQERKILVKEICKAAKSYKQYLVCNRFLYVFDNRYIEVIFKAQNFRHLTGVATGLKAKEFYRLASQEKLNKIRYALHKVRPAGVSRL